MSPRRTAVHPAAAAEAAREAAKAAAAAKAERSPGTLTAEEVQLLPGKTVLALGNAGKLRHLGLGLPLKAAAPATPKITATRSAGAPLTDADLQGMSGEAISKAMSAGDGGRDRAAAKAPAPLSTASAPERGGSFPRNAGQQHAAATAPDSATGGDPMPTRPPGELTSVAIAALDGGAMAQAVINDRTECLARLHADGAWSPWWPVTNGAKDVSVTADTSQGEASALIAVVILVPLPVGTFAAGHTFHQGAFYRLTSVGVVPADDLQPPAPHRNGA